MDAIEKGTEIYRGYAEQLGLPPDDCMKNLPSQLSAGWDVEGFLAKLGEDDIQATIEARQHFGLAVFE
jgi:hypothetical protein